MKALLFPALLVVAFVWTKPLLGGQEKKDPPVQGDAADEFYPRKPGTQWHYRTYHVKDDEPPAKAQGNFEKVVISVDGDDDIQGKYMKDGQEIVATKGDKPIVYRSTRLKVVSGEKMLFENIYAVSGKVYRLKAADKEIVPPLVFFEYSKKAKETWQVLSYSGGQKLQGSFTVEDAAVEVPEGKYNAKHVFSRDFKVGDQSMEIEYWFAPNRGIVKQRVKIGGHEVVLELEKFVPGK